MRHYLLATLLVLPACGSSEPPPDAQPAPTVSAPEKKAKVSVASSDGTRAAAKDTAGALPVGHVKFTVEKRPLDEVLRLFESQVGVRITWPGESRPVTLRIAQPMPWEDALSLVCQFTRTHLTRDYSGKFVLKDGWGGTLGSDDDVSALLKEQGGGASASGGSGSSGKSSSRGRPATGSAGAAPAKTPDRYNERGSGGLGKSEFGDAYSGGDDARRLLKGVSQTSSGPRK